MLCRLCERITVNSHSLHDCLCPQASFNPPGLTVAVKKDRAVENLMNNGSQFVVNILSEGDHKPLMKQLPKPFKPGEDRFAGLEIQACVTLLI